MPHGLSPGRYFLALWPTGPVRDGIARLAADWLASASGRFRAVHPRRYHLTLQFLGDLDPSGAQVLEAVLPALRALPGRPFRLLLDHAGHFGQAAGWLGCRRPPRELLDLQAGLTLALQRAGMPDAWPRQAFVPHVTVARGMRGAWPDVPQRVAQVSWDVDAWVLVRSDASAGHAYRVVARQPLDAA